MKKGSDEQTAPKKEIGGSSSARKNANAKKDYLESSKKKMKTYIESLSAVMKKLIKRLVKKKESGEQPAPKEEIGKSSSQPAPREETEELSSRQAPKEVIGESSSTAKNVKGMNHLENSKQKMQNYLVRVEYFLEPSNYRMLPRMPQAEKIKPIWRIVEVASSFDKKGMPAGGGYLLRDSNTAKTPMVAEAFQLQGESALFAEVCALREAIEMSTTSAKLRKRSGGFIFLFESEELAKCFTDPIFPVDYAGPIIEECRKDLVFFDFEFMQVPGEKLVAAKWLAEHGRASQKHSVFNRFKGSWPPGLVELLARPPLY